MIRMLPLFLILVLGLGSSQVVAQRPGMPRPDGPRSRTALEKRLVVLFDQDRDGRLDRREWRKARKILRELRPESHQTGERARADRGRHGGERVRQGTNHVRRGEDIRKSGDRGSWQFGIGPSSLWLERPIDDREPGDAIDKDVLHAAHAALDHDPVAGSAILLHIRDGPRTRRCLGQVEALW
jgi:hypothetical protein